MPQRIANFLFLCRTPKNAQKLVSGKNSRSTLAQKDAYGHFVSGERKYGHINEAACPAICLCITLRSAIVRISVKSEFSTYGKHWSTVKHFHPLSSLDYRVYQRNEAALRKHLPKF